MTSDNPLHHPSRLFWKKRKNLKIIYTNLVHPLVEKITLEKCV